MTPPAQVAGERVKRWTREAIIEKIQEWAALYGEPPRAADWNPSSAKWSGAEWRVERYQAGDWPSLNAAKAPFAGSFTAAIVAAGFEPTKPGPPRQNRKGVAPVLDEDRLVMEPRARALLVAAQGRVAELERTVQTRDRQLERAYAVNAAAREYVPAIERPADQTNSEEATPKTIIKTRTVRVKIADPETDRRLRRAEAEIARLERDQAAAAFVAEAAGIALREAKAAATKAASKLERAEATIATVRAERREAVAERKRAEDRAGAAEREAERLRAREPEVKVITSATDNELTAAVAARARAEREAREAEHRAAVAEREHREVAALVTGERRRLGRDEIAELRKRGPAGEKVLAGALRKLGQARAAGGKGPLAEALTLVAAAAVTWRERL